MQVMDYWWFITAGLMVIGYNIGVAKGEANITQDVLNIIEKESKK
jgi:hypothetical protein